MSSTSAGTSSPSLSSASWSTPSRCASASQRDACSARGPSRDRMLGAARDNRGMTAQPLRVALAQIDATVGDIDGNARKIARDLARARDEGAALVVFPELCLTGYPPEDLLLKTHF